MQDLTAITAALAAVEEEAAIRLVEEALAAGVPALKILHACQAGMVEVGARFEAGDYFISELMMSGEIFKMISALLSPGLKASGGASAGTVVLGTVRGDIHDIGKDIVATMLKSANIEVIDLGVDVEPAKFVTALKESGAGVVGLSGLLTLAFDSMKATIAALAEAGMRSQVKVMIGGGPVDATVCRVVGADDWGADAQHAVRIAKGWLEAAHA